MKKANQYRQLYNIKLLFTFGFLFSLSFHIWAQPANDNCGGAISLTVNASCTPTNGTTAGATQSQTSTVGNPNDDVWYSFVATQPSLAVQVIGSASFDAVLQVFSGTCGGSSLGIANNTGAGGTEILNFTNLFSGVTYWFRVFHFAATNPSNPTFMVCISNPMVEPICNPNSPEPKNTMNPISDVPKICELNGFCGTTLGYYATPGATQRTPYTADSWPELTSAFCGSIENNSFCKFTAAQSTVQLRIYGSCTSGSGIQLLVFSLNTPGLVAGAGPVTTYGCYNLIDLTPPPPQGIVVTFTNMVAGQDYFIMIDGNAGSICDYKIGADFGVQTSVNVTPSLANICLGNSINLTASGGNGSYTWNTNTELSNTVGSTNTATPTTTGTKTYVVSSPSIDPVCPSTSDTVVVNVTTIPTPNAGIDDTVCLGQVFALNGSVSNAQNAKLWQFIPPAGAAPTVQFSPSFSNLTPNVNVNKPGLYRFILRETSQLCGQYRDTMSMLVIDPVHTAVATEPTCFGLPNGQINIQSNYADEYSVDNGVTWSSSSLFVGLSSGTYDVCSRNYIGCTVCTQVLVPEGVKMDLVVSNDTLICENGTAALTALGNGGTGLVYNWSHTSDQNYFQLVSPSVNTVYSVFVSNSQGCQSGTDSIYVDLRSPISSSASSGIVICPNEEVTITVSANGGLGAPFQFAWSDGDNGSGISHSKSVAPATTTVYQVTVQDNCESTPKVMDIEVEVSPLPQPLFSVLEDSICEPATFKLYNQTDTAMTASVFWEFSNGASSAELDSLELEGLGFGKYSVNLTVTSPFGCVNTTSIPNLLNAMQMPKARFVFAPSPVKMLDATVNFQNLSAQGATSYYWEFPDAFPSFSEEPDPEVEYPSGKVGNYPVTLYAYTDFGCMDSTTDIVKVISEVVAYVPNTFTPDNDAHNQTWKFHVAGVDMLEFEVEVSNRWGQLVRSSRDPNAEWDGTYNGEIVQEGIYNYVMKAKDAITLDIHLFSGSLTILK